MYRGSPAILLKTIQELVVQLLGSNSSSKSFNRQKGIRLMGAIEIIPGNALTQVNAFCETLKGQVKHGNFTNYLLDYVTFLMINWQTFTFRIISRIIFKKFIWN
jgi:hypothetical protein